MTKFKIVSIVTFILIVLEHFFSLFVSFLKRYLISPRPFLFFITSSEEELKKYREQLAKERDAKLKEREKANASVRHLAKQKEKSKASRKDKKHSKKDKRDRRHRRGSRKVRWLSVVH